MQLFGEVFVCNTTGTTVRAGATLIACYILAPEERIEGMASCVPGSFLT